MVYAGVQGNDMSEHFGIFASFYTRICNVWVQGVALFYEALIGGKCLFYGGVTTHVRGHGCNLGRVTGKRYDI